MDLDRALLDEELTRVRDLVQRRRRREPVAYLLGRKEFWGRTFAVDPSVLVPRPDTETLVERALALLPGGKRVAREAPDAALVASQREAARDLPTHVEPVLEPEPTSGEVAPDEGASYGGVAPFAPVGTTTAPASTPAATDTAPDTAPTDTAPTDTAPTDTGVAPIRVLDLCTGSGCIGLTLACERPGLEVWITDVSAPALAIARANLEALAEDDPTLPARVSLHEGDLFAAAPPGARFDLVTCNPPYLSEAELAEVERDVRDHEPRGALVAGPRGDEILVRLAAEVRAWLVPGGVVLTEIGVTQGARVRALFERAGLVEVCVLQDLSGRDRVVEGHAPRGPR
jgi:methylase of polypeptide subunit release factors